MNLVLPAQQTGLEDSQYERCFERPGAPFTIVNDI